MVHDAAGRELRSLQADAMFTYRIRAANLCRDLDTHVRRLVAFLEASPYGATASGEVIRRAVEVMTSEVMYSAPAYECPNRPHPVDCKACGGKRWISEREDEETNRDLVPICPESWPEPPPSLTFRRGGPKSPMLKCLWDKNDSTSSPKEPLPNDSPTCLEGPVLWQPEICT